MRKARSVAFMRRIGSPQGRARVDGNHGDRFDVRWFGRWELPAAFAHGRAGGIALHRFRWDLRRVGLGRLDPACHMLSADHEASTAFGARFGLLASALEAPRPFRPDIWHFDLYGATLERLTIAYPLPVGIAGA
jgi:hypothetical protein